MGKINILEGGSNFAVGDRVNFSGGGLGAVAEVETVGVTGDVRRIDLLDQGIGISTAPSVDLYGIHSKTTFETRPTETIFYDDFTTYKTGGANSFFAIDDNRGAASNLASGHSANVSFAETETPSNYLPLPTTGLKAHWEMNQWHPESPEEMGLKLLTGTHDPFDSKGNWYIVKKGNVESIH